MRSADETGHKPGRLLAKGGTAEIYEWEPGWVLKLFLPRYGDGFAEFERRIARSVCATGLPVPAVGGIVGVDGREGLLYQRVEGIGMGEDLEKHPWRLVSHARTLAELQAEMHAAPMQAEIPALPSRLEKKIREAKPLPEDIRRAALKLLESMPGGDRLCHGDFHPGNVIIGKQGAVIIDWVDVAIGNPLADVARTLLLAGGMIHAEGQFSRLQQTGLRLFQQVYLRRYFQLRPGGWEETQRWLPIVAAGRLSEGIAGWEAWLLEQAAKIEEAGH